MTLFSLRLLSLHAFYRTAPLFNVYVCVLTMFLVESYSEKQPNYSKTLYISLSGV